jgi:hypothetical protein
MLIISLVLAVIGLAALVFAVITSNELVAWVCIGASLLGVVLLIIDALQERRRREAGHNAPDAPDAGSTDEADAHDEDVAVDNAAETVDESADTSIHKDAADSVSDDHTSH